MNFLVTGGAGFIGSHVSERLLRDGHAVWAFDDLNDFYDPKFKRRNLRDLQALAKPFEFHHGDITDRAALDELFAGVRFDQVIHLAARAGVRPSLADPALYQRVNVEGTVNVLEAARRHGIPVVQTKHTRYDAYFERTVKQWDIAAGQLLFWDHADMSGVEIEVAGLKARREAEFNLWTSTQPETPAAAPAQGVA